MYTESVEGSQAGFFVASKAPDLCDSAEPSTSLATSRIGRFVCGQEAMMYDEAIARLFAHIEKLDQDIAFLQQERIAAREAIIRLGGNPDGNSLTITPLVTPEQRVRDMFGGRNPLDCVPFI